MVCERLVSLWDLQYVLRTFFVIGLASISLISRPCYMRNIKLQIAQTWDKFALYYAEEARHLDEINAQGSTGAHRLLCGVHQTILKGSDERRRMVGCFENTQASRRSRVARA